MVGLRPSPPACAKDYPESSPIPELYPGQMPQEDRLRGILIFYRVRLLTARPMREAYLGVIDRGPEFEMQIFTDLPLRKDISLENLNKESRLEKFMKENPQDIRLKGNDEYIVFTMTEAWRPYSTDVYSPAGRAGQTQSTNIEIWKSWRERTRPDQLASLELSDLVKATLLSTKNGEKTPLVRYEQPAGDNLGAKFYFPRLLPDGHPFVTLKDEELRFETRVGGKKIVAKFDLKKLIYQGKLEI
jgi:hypothetical protein